MLLLGFSLQICHSEASAVSLLIDSCWRGMINCHSSSWNTLCKSLAGLLHSSHYLQRQQRHFPIKKTINGQHFNWFCCGDNSKSLNIRPHFLALLTFYILEILRSWVKVLQSCPYKSLHLKKKDIQIQCFNSIFWNFLNGAVFSIKYLWESNLL